MLAVISSSVCTFAAGWKSWRRPNNRHEPSGANPTRSMFTRIFSPSRRSELPFLPLMMPTVKWLDQSSPHSGR